MKKFVVECITKQNNFTIKAKTLKEIINLIPKTSKILPPLYLRDDGRENIRKVLEGEK